MTCAQEVSVGFEWDLEDAYGRHTPTQKAEISHIVPVGYDADEGELTLIATLRIKNQLRINEPRVLAGVESGFLTLRVKTLNTSVTTIRYI